jgi:hypothetical protein
MKTRIMVLVVLALCAALLFNCQTGPAEMTDQEKVELGERLVASHDCILCHTPKMMTDQGPVPNPDLLLSGHPGDQTLSDFPMSLESVMTGQWILATGSFTSYVGPWGITYSGNLTPADEGLGNWTLEAFDNALRQGWYKGIPNGRRLQPPMPWEAFSHLTDQEVEAIYLYLSTIKPVSNVSPPYIPPDRLPQLTESE